MVLAVVQVVLKFKLRTGLWAFRSVTGWTVHGLVTSDFPGEDFRTSQAKDVGLTTEKSHINIMVEEDGMKENYIGMKEHGKCQVIIHFQLTCPCSQLFQKHPEDIFSQ